MEDVLSLIADYMRTMKNIHPECRRRTALSHCTTCQVRIGGLYAMAEQMKVMLDEVADTI